MTRSVEGRKHAVDLGIVIGLAVALAAVVAFKIHFSEPVAPARVGVLNDLLQGRSIAYTPYPVGYIAFAAMVIRWFGNQGLVVVQGMLYVITVLLSYETLRSLRVSRGAALAGGLAVAVYPVLIFTITKFSDTTVSCFLVSLYAWLLLRLRREGLTRANATIGGLLFGLMVLIRPNALMLAPLAIWLAFRGHRMTIAPLMRLAGAGALAVCVVAAVVIPLKGRFEVFDRYYASITFAHGTHQHALEGMLRDYNGEMMMPQSLRELGLPYQGLERSDPTFADQYIRMGWQFIRDHPCRYAAIEAFKIFNLFRPDYRNVRNSFMPPIMAFAIHTAVAALFVAWVLLRWLCRRFIGISDGLVLIPMLLLYFAPFVATNTDPRYRIPIDALLIIESVVCVSLLWKNSNISRVSSSKSARPTEISLLEIPRILYIQYTNPGGYPPLEHSSRILADAGWEVLFLGTGALGAAALRFPPHPRITVRKLKFQNEGWRQKLHYVWFGLWCFVWALRSRPRWIYASDPLSCPVALCISGILGSRLIYHEHDSPARANKVSGFMRVCLTARRACARRAEICVIPNRKRALQFAAETTPTHRVEVVWNCPSRSEVVPAANRKVNQGLRLLYHGSIVPDRLPLSILDALTALPDDVTLTIVGYETKGSTGYLDALRDRARRLGILQRVQIMGPAVRSELLNIARSCDVGLALLPITSEDGNFQAMTGASNKPFDYLACGLAVLVSDLPDWRELFVKPGYGLPCDPSQPESVAAAVRYFCDTPGAARRMGMKGQQRILSDWNYEAEFEKVLAAWDC